MKSLIHNYHNKYLMMSKTLFIVLVICFMSISSYAQQGINYKVLIKDVNGNALINTNNINVQFTIYEGAAFTNPVYLETHTNVVTDANGIIILNIGNGTTTDVFANVAWGNDEHWLDVKINIGTGLVGVSTTQFMAVPYALSAANVTGLEKITESIDSDTGDPIYGWVLNGRNSAFYGNIGENAVALSSNSNLVEGRIFGATGEFSTALGVQTSAAGYASTSSGLASEALADLSTAMGYGTITNEFGSMAFGICNVDVPESLFVVGNGDFNLGAPIRSNALTILKNGTITAPSFDISEITDDKALITKEYADSNLGSSGLEKITEGVFTGWRLKNKDPLQYGNIGDAAVDLSYSDTNTAKVGATGLLSFATGYVTIASGDIATAIGSNTIASGDSSTAMGSSTIASGSSSTAMGSITIASGSNSMAIGNNTIASGHNTLALGSFNIDDVSSQLIVGIGSSDTNRKNALTVKKNGAFLAPDFQISEIMDSKALITKEYADTNYLNADGNVITGGPLTIQNATDATSTWRLETRSNGSLSMYRNGSYRGFFSESTGNYSSISDRRTKKAITALENGTLNKVMQLNPVSYLMKDQKGTKRNLGLISQEVQQIFPSITYYVEEADLITLSYTELIPILIKALQEQQTIIDGQNTQIETMSADNSMLKSKDIAQDKSISNQSKTIENLVARLNSLELKSSN